MHTSLLSWFPNSNQSTVQKRITENRSIRLISAEWSTKSVFFLSSLAAEWIQMKTASESLWLLLLLLLDSLLMAAANITAKNQILLWLWFLFLLWFYSWCLFPTNSALLFTLFSASFQNPLPVRGCTLPAVFVLSLFLAVIFCSVLSASHF